MEELRPGGHSGDNYKMDISRIIVIKWVIVVVGSFVGGYITGIMPAVFLELAMPDPVVLGIGAHWPEY